MGFRSGKWAVNYVRCSMGSGRYVIQYGRFYVRCSMCMAGAMLGMSGLSMFIYVYGGSSNGATYVSIILDPF
jgi:hypothetical protein